MHACNKIYGGADQTRTDDPLLAKQVLYQLSYNPTISLKRFNIVGNLLLKASIFYIFFFTMSNENYQFSTDSK